VATDPVCKMTVDENAPAATSECNGATYYFCALGCKVAFDEDPEKYLRTSQKRSLLSRLIPMRKSRLGH
jgi:YHS domain-containing protein